MPTVTSRIGVAGGGWLASRYRTGLANPSGWSPWLRRYWSTRTVIAAHTGVASEVPPSLTHRPPARTAAPLDGAASAATSGTSRQYRPDGCPHGWPSAYELTTPGARCHAGWLNRTDGPPVDPWDSSGSVHAAWPRNRPAVVSCSAVPPTLVTWGRSPGNEMPAAGIRRSRAWKPRHSSPPESPLATNAVVPLRPAACTAAFAAAASAGVKTVSHWPRLMLHTAPGYRRAAAEKACVNWAAGGALRPPKAARFT